MEKPSCYFISILCAVLVGLHPVVCKDGSYVNRTTEFLAALVAEDYSAEETMQWLNGEPVIVNVSLHFEGMGSVDIKQMIFSLDTYLKFAWYDPRLKHVVAKGININSIENMKKIWTPDIYFANSREATFQDVLKPNRFIHIDPSGSVYLSTRVLLKPVCGFRLQNFPFDTQECELNIQSYASAVEQMLLNWREYDPVHMNPGIQLPEMKILEVVHESSAIEQQWLVEKDENAKFSMLSVKFKFHRRPAHYVIVAIIPNAIVVVISWFAFWIDPQSTPARVTLLFTSFLTLTTSSITTANMIPPVSYATALGIWSQICVLFVFAALVEFGLVYNYQNGANILAAQSKATNTDEGKLMDDAADKELVKKKMEKLRSTAIRIDQVSQILFPVCFSIYVIVFISYYSLI